MTLNKFDFLSGKSHTHKIKIKQNKNLIMPITPYIYYICIQQLIAQNQMHYKLFNYNYIDRPKKLQLIVYV